MSEDRMPPDEWIAAARRSHRIDRWATIDPRALEPEERVRKLCEDDLCGSYGRHHQCPPAAGALEACEERLHRFGGGILVQSTYVVDPSDREATAETRLAFHLALLAVEAAARAGGEPEAWGLVGGPCALCRPCTAVDGEPCVEPDRARPSLEALGVDVVALQGAIGWDGAFHDDRVTWTGAVLYAPSRELTSRD